MVGALGFVLAPKSVAAAADIHASAKPELNIVDIGDLYSYGYATSRNPALRKAAPPTLQALNQVQAANSGVRMNALFIPVSAATSGALFASGTSQLPALINAVKRSSVVIVGVGGGNSPLAGSIRSVLFGGAAPAKTFTQLMTSFDDGYYLYNQAALLGAIAAHAAPGTSIVTLGYPAVTGKQGPSAFTWWSPYTWGTVSQQQANMSDQLVSALNTADSQATSMVAAAHPNLHFLYASPSNGTPSGSQARPSEATIGNDLLPYVSQAANNKLATMNVRGSQNAAPASSAASASSVAPASPWRLNVVLPVLTQAAPRPAATPAHAAPAKRAAAVSPQNSLDNPDTLIYAPPVWPGLLASPAQPAAVQPAAGVASHGSAPAAHGGGEPAGPQGAGQSKPLVQLKSIVELILPGVQPAGKPGQAASGQPAASGKSAPSSAASAKGKAPKTPSHTPSMIPVPPAPLPESVTPAVTPDATGTGSGPAGDTGTPSAATPPAPATVPSAPAAAPGSSAPAAASAPPAAPAAAPAASASSAASAPSAPAAAPRGSASAASAVSAAPMIPSRSAASAGAPAEPNASAPSAPAAASAPAAVTAAAPAASAPVAVTASPAAPSAPAAASAPPAAPAAAPAASASSAASAAPTQPAASA